MSKIRMNTATFAVAASALLCVPAIGLAASDASALAGKYGCTGCHSVDKKIVGPSYKEVAAKYRGHSGALATLEEKVKAGGSGVWGPIPMPPNNVPAADLKELVQWILAAK